MTVHSPVDRKFPCEVPGCMSKFTLKHHLVRHMKAIH